MGLDMYLYRREYVGGWDWANNATDKDERPMYDAILEYMNAERCEGSPHAYIEVCVAYWRKANSIHKWFCDLDGGRDECQSIYVSHDKLLELRDICKSILLVPSAAPNLMPTQAGFFFGSYDYDAWYMQDMENTVKQLDSVLASIGPDTWVDFIYRASW